MPAELEEERPELKDSGEDPEFDVFWKGLLARKAWYENRRRWLGYDPDDPTPDGELTTIDD